MTARAMILAGTTFVFLTGLALAGESTTAEKEATRQLNLQAAINAAPSPQQVTVIDAAASTAAAASGTLSMIANPPSKIATANILDNTGKTVGAVEKIEVSPEGKPTRVFVALTGAKQSVVLDASAVSYDAHKNEITAQGVIPSNG